MTFSICSFFFLIDQFEFHVDNVHVMLIDLLFMLQYLITSRKFAILQFHLFLSS